MSRQSFHKIVFDLPQFLLGFTVSACHLKFRLFYGSRGIYRSKMQPSLVARAIEIKQKFSSSSMLQILKTMREKKNQIAQASVL